jgi:hypothetical protein
VLITVYLAHFVAGALFANGIPHFVSGVCGRPFRTPFVRLGGAGATTSSATTNIVWGWLNWLVAYVLFLDVGPRYLGSLVDTVAAAGGVLVMGLVLAQIFSRENRGLI